ncbi:unnamed protein product [Rotaria sp. Silwood1]|nr:unnamed protein product [Rotaria sp. Silwood1]CAF1689026.1 unnamed protein product [Rotaria sp. Silwood1]CAF3822471.1 unnamed protein product [Rotaria sp. Silwood1]CAF3847054.1 unnamed protein product [Rotaria sp. Silwood1]CAF4741543.1 unnamed protein product [Rotaria sp. Silwood1]
MNLTGGSDEIGNYRLELAAQNKFDEPKMKDVNITYTCHNSFDCAKIYYLLTIQTLIQNEPILDKIEAEIFDPTVVNIQQCSDDQDQPITCQNGYGCHGYEIIENGQIDFEGECRNDSTVTIFPRQYFRITLVQGDPPLSSDWNHFGFTCNKQNLCNTRQQIKKMVKIANDFYPWELIPPNSSTNDVVIRIDIVLGENTKNVAPQITTSEENLGVVVAVLRSYNRDKSFLLN